MSHQYKQMCFLYEYALVIKAHGLLTCMCVTNICIGIATFINEWQWWENELYTLQNIYRLHNLEYCWLHFIFSNILLFMLFFVFLFLMIEWIKISSPNATPQSHFGVCFVIILTLLIFKKEYWIQHHPKQNTKILHTDKLGIISNY